MTSNTQQKVRFKLYYRIIFYSNTLIVNRVFYHLTFQLILVSFLQVQGQPYYCSMDSWPPAATGSPTFPTPVWAMYLQMSAMTCGLVTAEGTPGPGNIRLWAQTLRSSGGSGQNLQLRYIHNQTSVSWRRKKIWFLTSRNLFQSHLVIQTKEKFS